MRQALDDPSLEMGQVIDKNFGEDGLPSTQKLEEGSSGHDQAIYGATTWRVGAGRPKSIKQQSGIPNPLALITVGEVFNLLREEQQVKQEIEWKTKGWKEYPDWADCSSNQSQNWNQKQDTGGNWWSNWNSGGSNSGGWNNTFTREQSQKRQSNDEVEQDSKRAKTSSSSSSGPGEGNPFMLE